MAKIRVLGADEVKTNRDLIDYTVNIAAKICQCAETNAIQIGESVYRNIHVSRKKWFKMREPLPAGWKYEDDLQKGIYRLFVA